MYYLHQPGSLYPHVRRGAITELASVHTTLPSEAICWGRLETQADIEPPQASTLEFSQVQSLHMKPPQVWELCGIVLGLGLNCPYIQLKS